MEVIKCTIKASMDSKDLIALQVALSTTVLAPVLELLRPGTSDSLPSLCDKLEVKPNPLASHG